MDKKKGEWIELNLPFYDSCDSWPNKSKNSFKGLELDNPGTLIETSKGMFLIGDINIHGGLCDYDAAFTREEIVKRYKIIWDGHEDQEYTSVNEAVQKAEKDEIMANNADTRRILDYLRGKLQNDKEVVSAIENIVEMLCEGGHDTLKKVEKELDLNLSQFGDLNRVYELTAEFLRSVDVCKELYRGRGETTIIDNLLSEIQG